MKLRLFKKSISILVTMVFFFACTKNEDFTSFQSEHTESQHGFGYIPSTREQLDGVRIYKAKNILSREILPNDYKLPDLPEALHQGLKPSCVSYAIAHARTIMSKENKTNADGTPNYSNYASGDYLYEKYKLSRTSCKSGVYITEVLDALKADGDCSYEDMPKESCGAQPKRNIDQNANLIRFRIHDYYIIEIRDNNYLELFKSLLTKGHPIITGIQIDEDFKNIRDTKTINVWDVNNSSKKGPHAIVITGYNDTKKAFKILNSWGPNWGDKGYCWVTYNKMNQEMNKEAYMKEVYIMDVNNSLIDAGTSRGSLDLKTVIPSAQQTLYNKPEYREKLMSNGALNWDHPIVKNDLKKYESPSLNLTYYTANNKDILTTDLQFEIRIKMKSYKETFYSEGFIKGLELFIGNKRGDWMSIIHPINGKECILKNKNGEIISDYYSDINFDDNNNNNYITLSFEIKDGSFYKSNYSSTFKKGLDSMNHFSIKFIGTIGSIDDIRVYHEDKQIGVETFDGEKEGKPSPLMQWYE